MKSIYLENTTINSKTGNRHNKFYRMEKLGNNRWIAVWGKIGTTGKSTEYSMLEWDKKLSEKIKKGYILCVKNSSLNSINDSYLKRMEKLIVLLGIANMIRERETVVMLKVNYSAGVILRSSALCKMNEYYKEVNKKLNGI